MSRRQSWAGHRPRGNGFGPFGEPSWDGGYSAFDPFHMDDMMDPFAFNPIPMMSPPFMNMFGPGPRWNPGWGGPGFGPGYGGQPRNFSAGSFRPGGGGGGGGGGGQHSYFRGPAPRREPYPSFSIEEAAPTAPADAYPDEILSDCGDDPYYRPSMSRENSTQGRPGTGYPGQSSSSSGKQGSNSAGGHFQEKNKYGGGGQMFTEPLHDGKDKAGYGKPDKHGGGRHGSSQPHGSGGYGHGSSGGHAGPSGQSGHHHGASQGGGAGFKQQQPAGQKPPGGTSQSSQSSTRAHAGSQDPYGSQGTRFSQGSYGGFSAPAPQHHPSHHFGDSPFGLDEWPPMMGRRFGPPRMWGGDWNDWGAMPGSLNQDGFAQGGGFFFSESKSSRPCSKPGCRGMVTITKTQSPEHPHGKVLTKSTCGHRVEDRHQ